MDVANVISHQTPAMRALRRVAGDRDRPPAPFERSGEDEGIPAPLSRRVRTADSATGERGRAESWTARTHPVHLSDGAPADHNAAACAHGLLTVRHRAGVAPARRPVQSRAGRR